MILYFEDEWGWDRATASSLQSVVHVFNGLATIVSGQVADTCPATISMGGGILFLAVCYFLVSVMSETWQVWVVYGVLCGSAYGALNLNVFSVVVMRCIPRERQGVAVGIATAGSTVGMFLLVPLFSFIAAEHGWRLGYVLLGSAVAALAVPAMLLLRIGAKASGGDHGGDNQGANTAAVTAESVLSQIELTAAPAPEPVPAMAPASSSPALPPAAPETAVSAATAAELAAEDLPPERPVPMSQKLRSLFASRAFWLLSFSFVVCGVTTTGFVETHIVALAVHRGESVETGALAFSVLSACNGLGMVIAGWLSDRVSRSLTLSAIFVVRGGSFLLLMWVPTRSVLFVFAVIFGFVDYSVVPPVVSLVGSHAGQHVVGLGVGILLAWHSVAAALGSYIGGLLYTDRGDYDDALLVCAIVCFAAGGAVLGVCPEPLLRAQRAGADREVEVVGMKAEPCES